MFPDQEKASYILMRQHWLQAVIIILLVDGKLIDTKKNDPVKIKNQLRTQIAKPLALMAFCIYNI